MSKVLGAKKLTNFKFLNLFELDAVYKDGTVGKYQVTSRAGSVLDLKAISGRVEADAVAICANYIFNEKPHLILIRQYRYPVGDYIYELPAGLRDGNETILETAVREMKEETGLDLTGVKLSEELNRPFFSSPGMTDETCSLVFGRCVGTPSSDFLEKTEDARVILADYDECYRILREEKIDMRTAAAIWLFVTAFEGLKVM
jgi:ADP-ribose pyrophosphatase